MPERAVYPLGWSRRDLRHFVSIGVTGLVVLWFLWQVQSILPPFIIAFLWAALMEPTLCRWERKGRSRLRSILSVYALGLTVLVLLIVWIGPRVVSQVEDLARNSDSYVTALQENAERFLTRNQSALRRFGVDQAQVEEQLNAQSGPVRARIAAVLGGITLFVAGFASKALWLIIIPIVGFFLMLDFPALRARAISLCPPSYQREVDRVSLQVVEVFGEYLRGLTRICTLYGLSALALFWVLGLDYALFLGVLGGLFYTMPMVGGFLTAGVAGIVAYLMPAHKTLWLVSVPANSIQYAITTVVLVILLNNLFDQLLYPRMVGGSVGLHPVLSIFALMAGATLFGIPGMLLAVPVAASVQVVLRACFPRLAEPPAPLSASPDC